MSVRTTPIEAALRALTPSQLSFLERLPKAELHAHLNGSIPLPLLQDLAREYTPSTDNTSKPVMAADIQAGVRRLQAGSAFNSIEDFFEVFPAVIYALTSTPASLKRATRAILSHFLDPPIPLSASDANSGSSAVEYIELRTTPRETPHMSRRVYLETVLDEIEVRSPDAAALIVSLDRRMSPDVARGVLELAVQLRREGRRVVGLDLCGDPTVRYPYIFLRGMYALPSAQSSGANSITSAQCDPPLPPLPPFFFLMFLKGG
jgi:adenosine deaminase